MLLFSSVLEMQAHHLRRDALRVVNATLSGTATTGFWTLLEGFFGVDEDPALASLEDAASLAEALHLYRAEKEKDAQVASLSVPAENVTDDPDEPEAEEILDTESTTSSQLMGEACLKTLSQSKKHHDKVDEYPNKCNIAEAQLFFLRRFGIPAQNGMGITC